MVYQAIGKNVVLKYVPEEEATKSGIVIQRTKKFTSADGEILFRKGEVVTVGNKVESEWGRIEKGFKVLFNMADAHEIDVDEHLYVVDCVGIPAIII